MPLGTDYAIPINSDNDTLLILGGTIINKVVSLFVTLNPSYYLENGPDGLPNLCYSGTSALSASLKDVTTGDTYNEVASEFVGGRPKNHPPR
jgi:hypothetical protein